MLKRLRELFIGKPPIVLEHEVFGSMRFMGSDKPDVDDYWEAEWVVDEGEEPLSILVNAPESGPIEAHIAFFQAVVSDLDALFDRCWPVFQPDFEEWTSKAFDGNWREDFKLVSLEIPKDGDVTNEWTVSYFVDAANHYFTARFIGGEPRCNEIDG
jgi:hypothetical protein